MAKKSKETMNLYVNSDNENVFNRICPEMLMRAWSYNITSYVNEYVRRIFDMDIRQGALEREIKRCLNKEVDRLLKLFDETKLTQPMQDYIAETDMRQFIKDIFEKELEYEF